MANNGNKNRKRKSLRIIFIFCGGKCSGNRANRLAVQIKEVVSKAIYCLEDGKPERK
jgi:predicted metal-binding protein